MKATRIVLESGFGLLPAATLEESFRAGQSFAWHGASLDNCHYKFFATPEHTREWERGKREAEDGAPEGKG